VDTDILSACHQCEVEQELTEEKTATDLALPAAVEPKRKENFNVAAETESTGNKRQ